MTRDNLLFAIIGILLGFIVGFMFASSMSQKQAMQQQQAAAGSQAMPADHPPVGAQNAPNPQGMQQEVAASLEKARSEPKNFDAQIKAAQLYYQIQRYDQSIEYLLKANQIKPTDYQTVVTLGLVNMDAGHYDVAEKWYRAALKMKSDDAIALAGLAATTLEKGDAKAAEDAIAQLEKVDPNAEDLPNFKTRLATLKAGK
ncbi:MAG TPA: tetratricopeptide repeat protein [Pyrinomonadaceae bacterium]|jgi:tetratricopeptide (TPR) repeat protein|nr:tetratricopeptide repeat protein [Pyrinomonadaceae bacterium]